MFSELYHFDVLILKGLVSYSVKVDVKTMDDYHFRVYKNEMRFFKKKL